MAQNIGCNLSSPYIQHAIFWNGSTAYNNWLVITDSSHGELFLQLKFKPQSVHSVGKHEAHTHQQEKENEVRGWGIQNSQTINALTSSSSRWRRCGGVGGVGGGGAVHWPYHIWQQCLPFLEQLSEFLPVLTACWWLSKTKETEHQSVRTWRSRGHSDITQDH